mgnify:CR=1 FL=1
MKFSDSEEIHLEEDESFEDCFHSLISRDCRNLNGSLDLPTFDGNFGQWLRFKQSFTSLAHNAKQLLDIDRFNGSIFSRPRRARGRISQRVGR